MTEEIKVGAKVTITGVVRSVDPYGLLDVETTTPVDAPLLLVGSTRVASFENPPKPVEKGSIVKDRNGNRFMVLAVAGSFAWAIPQPGTTPVSILMDAVTRVD